MGLSLMLGGATAVFAGSPPGKPAGNAIKRFGVASGCHWVQVCSMPQVMPASTSIESTQPAQSQVDSLKTGRSPARDWFSSMARMPLRSAFGTGTSMLTSFFRYCMA